VTGLDTSVVLRMLTGEPADQAVRAAEFLDDLFQRGEQAAVSDMVVAEAYFALQHHYGVPKHKALAALRAMFREGEIVPGGVAAEVLEARGLASAKPGFVDRMIHRAYRDQGAPMATFEKTAKRLDGTMVLVAEGNHQKA